MPLGELSWNDITMVMNRPDLFSNLPATTNAGTYELCTNLTADVEKLNMTGSPIGTLIFKNKIHCIEDVEVINNKVIIVRFTDGDVQKAVCTNDDIFDFHTGCLICIAKHLAKGQKNLYKMVRDCERIRNDKEILAMKTKEALKVAENQKARKERQRLRKLERRRNREIDIQAEAYVRAMKMMEAKKHD